MEENTFATSFEALETTCAYKWACVAAHCPLLCVYTIYLHTAHYQVSQSPNLIGNGNQTSFLVTREHSCAHFRKSMASSTASGRHRFHRRRQSIRMKSWMNEWVTHASETKQFLIPFTLFSAFTTHNSSNERRIFASVAVPLYFFFFVCSALDVAVSSFGWDALCWNFLLFQSQSRSMRAVMLQFILSDIQLNLHTAGNEAKKRGYFPALVTLSAHNSSILRAIFTSFYLCSSRRSFLSFGIDASPIVDGVAVPHFIVRQLCLSIL